MVVRSLLKLTEKAVVYNSWKQYVFKESRLVDKLQLVLCLLGGVPAHGNILKYGLEVGLDHLVQKLRVVCFVKVLN